MERLAKAGHLITVVLIGIGLVVALTHHSEAPLFFGRYSLFYALALLGGFAIWALLIPLGLGWFRRWLRRHPGPLLGVGGGLLLFLLLEGGIRSVLALTLDRDYFWYGREHLLILMHQLTRGGHRESYHKYPPLRWRRGRIENRINNLGFRGRDVTVDKPAGALRIVTLGESSTFGRGVRDGWTYPERLERMLSDRVHGLRVEVVNLATPHNDSSSLAVLFRTEGLRLRPDIVTLCAGANDTIFLDSALRSPFFQQLEKLSVFLSRYSLAKQQFSLWIDRLIGPTVYSEEFLRGLASKAVQLYIANVDQIRESCEGAGARLVLVTQQYTSGAERNELGDLRRMTYQQERQALSYFVTVRGGLNWRFGAMFYIHARLMDELRAYAAAHDVLLVDGIAALDPYRSRDLVNWVDLSEEGNGVLAATIAEKLAPALQQPGSPDRAAQGGR